MDWGYAAPGCVLWWVPLADERWHVHREMKFRMISADEVCRRIRAVCDDLKLPRSGVRTFLADPSMWAAEDTGVSLAQRFRSQNHGPSFPLSKANNDRVSGWQQVNDLFELRPDGRPWLTVSPRCNYLIRSLLQARCDNRNPEDVDTNTDDHALDALRYGAGYAARRVRRVARAAYGRNTAGAMLESARKRARREKRRHA